MGLAALPQRLWRNYAGGVTDLPTKYQNFLDALGSAIAAEPQPATVQALTSRVLQAPGREAALTPEPFAMDRKAAELLSGVDVAAQRPSLTRLWQAFAVLVPHLHWYARALPDQPVIQGGHRHALIVGQSSALIPCEQATIGVTVMVAGLEYPIHSHPPAEVYLPMTPGRFYNADQDWQQREPGDCWYNPPGIDHSFAALPHQGFMSFWLLGPASAHP